jgi:hypothetical protein
VAATADPLFLRPVGSLGLLAAAAAAVTSATGNRTTLLGLVLLTVLLWLLATIHYRDRRAPRYAVGAGWTGTGDAAGTVDRATRTGSSSAGAVIR